MRNSLAVCAGLVLVLGAVGVARANVSASLKFTVTVDGGSWVRSDFTNTQVTLAESMVDGSVSTVGPVVGVVSASDEAGGVIAATGHSSAKVFSLVDTDGPIKVVERYEVEAFGVTGGNSADATAFNSYSELGGFPSFQASGPVTVTMHFNYSLLGSDSALSWLAQIDMKLHLWSDLDTPTGSLTTVADWLDVGGTWIYEDSRFGGPPDGGSVLDGVAVWTFETQAGSTYYIAATGLALAGEEQAAVPEPITLLSTVTALGSLGLYVRRRFRLAGGA